MKYQVIKNSWCGSHVHVKVGRSIYGLSSVYYTIDDINTAFQLMNSNQRGYVDGCSCVLEVAEYTGK